VNRFVTHWHGGVAVVEIEGELGPERQTDLERAVAGCRRVLLDLRRTRHIHYRVAARLLALSREGLRVDVVGPNPYVRQILRFAGALEGDLREYADLREALEDEAA